MNTTLIIRHRRENLKKCSLRGLEGRDDLHFFSYPVRAKLPDLTDYVLLSFDAPLLSEEDRLCGLILLDATWRLAEKMEKALPPAAKLRKRSLPKSLQTAYPRRQDDCPEPSLGLASIEALYAAYTLMGKKRDGLLDGYYWREAFLEKNRNVL